MTVSERLRPCMEIFGHRKEVNLRNHIGRLSLIQTLLLFLQSVSLVYFLCTSPLAFQEGSPYMDIRHNREGAESKRSISWSSRGCLCIFIDFKRFSSQHGKSQVVVSTLRDAVIL